MSTWYLKFAEGRYGVHRAIRYHDFSAGHRVVGHENKCRYIHGHNYRTYFHCEARLDKVGRVLDFGEIKNKLCLWLEHNWDHRFLMWSEDPIAHHLGELFPESLVLVPFNPTAENMAEHLVEVVGPKQLAGTDVLLKQVIVEETRKCSASYTLEGQWNMVHTY